MVHTKYRAMEDGKVMNLQNNTIEKSAVPTNMFNRNHKTGLQNLAVII